MDNINQDEALVEQEIVDECERLAKTYAEKLGDIGKDKIDFLLNMSHDIRTPMNAIIGFTQLAINNKDDGYLVTEYLEKVKTASDYLMSLLDDVLDITKIEQGEYVLEEGEVVLADFLISLEDKFKDFAEEKKLSLTFECDELLHDVVWADRAHLAKVFENMISNSIRYTKPGGSVEVSLSEKPGADDETGCYVFVIKDNGIGMNEGHIKQMSNTECGKRKTDVRDIQGSGIGMAIIKNFVAMMNGKIDISSKPDAGTTVTVTFPFRYSNTKRMDACFEDFRSCENVRFDGMRVLIVEDNLLNREIAVNILSDLGVVTEEAENGEIAVEMVKNSKPGYYDLVLMDIEMPQMDGYRATRAIRSLDDSAISSVPIYALSANVYQEQKKKSLDAGMNGHIIKPLEIDQLIKILKENAPEGVMQIVDKPEKAEGAAEDKRYTILITDDVDINRRFLRHMLCERYNIIEAKNGREALDILKKGDRAVHLIMLDLSMPVMNGFEFMEIWRDDPELSKIPIMVETAGVVSESELNCFRLGASDFIKRPYQSDAVLYRVEKLLKNRYERADNQ